MGTDEAHLDPQDLNTLPEGHGGTFHNDNQQQSDETLNGFDCRKKCMHCGSHCIYLKNQEEI